MWGMKAKEAIKLIEKEGWYFVRQAGSHKIFKHPKIAENISIPDHGKDDIKAGLLKSIFKVAGIK
jgi:predicted RNA binding protein YcfA (HicA-like mRNA interferase family)